ncbi:MULTISPECIES: gliding motility-associated C-terminal domain-containing protein [Maribacter]|uniref:Gliding motility-associated C-terminal domain-containing protein n=1 Tax=Maribacter flavus TaxID=1658664 RepID=A0ABU7ILR3_9FLAO|nr:MULTISPECIES: gliding motility-associated C-terminal domain-containing protein [Maribacter]MDC6406651.1 gliding motility-associated C-terminal domain-containing protein [Maribacter sp. PR66]MEE1973907.1 gliding motility-associated C-terminal domain-containing protein [Maribacter flavus]
MFGMLVSNAQFLLQAPNSTDENNYRWYEASDTGTVLGTDFFYEVTAPGIYFATYDGTLCGSNATGYFIVTDCNNPDNQVTLDITNNVSGGATVSWSPAVSGDPTRPIVTATDAVVRYTATVTKAGNDFALPNFTVVCLPQAANLVDDVVSLDEDTSVIVDIYANDSDLPNPGTLTTTSPSNGTVTIDDNGTPNNPLDDVLTYTPNPDFNGADSFDYTVCNSFGDCSMATVTIDVLPIVDTFDDTIAILVNEIRVIDEWALNDNDIPTLGTFSITQPTNGSATIDDNGTPNDPSDDTITYFPNNDFVGSDAFEYTLCDDAGNCSTSTITMIVSPSNTDLDSDNDGILDSFEDLNLDADNDPATNPTDTDLDGYPDYLDIDSDNDGIPDNVEAQTTSGYIAPSGTDANGNGVDDAYETGGNLGLFPIDTDGDSLPDYLDEDSDNDNVPDSIEAHDQNHDGIAELTLFGSDQDGDGLDDGYEGSNVNDIDVNDELDDPYGQLPNTDSDLESDYRDTDDDDDGIETIDEDLNMDGDYSNDDSDGDGTPNYLDSDLGELSEQIEVFNVITPNGDGVHDVLRIDGLENYPNNTIRIYNRWGVSVFTTRAYNTEGNVFDGTSQGRVTVDQSNRLPVGTYFYILDYEEPNGTIKQLSGYIYINR